MSRLSTNKDMNKFLRQLAKGGWKIDGQGTKHIHCTAPNGVVLTASRTPSDRFAFANFKADVRRALSQSRKETA